MAPHPMGPPGMGMPPPPPMDMAPPHANAARFDKDAWFATLPADELLPGELALREAIIAWVRRWPQLRPSNRPAGSPPHLADTGLDNDIRRCRTDVLPSKVRLAEWIERRIGGEVELRGVGNGQHAVFLRGSAPPEAEAPAARNSGGRDGGSSRNGSGGGSPEEKERFFASLPQDEFSQEEDDMRAVLLDFLERWTGSNPPLISDCSSEEEFTKARRSLLPKGCPVSLKEWIDNRIGGEIETRAGTSGSWMFGLRGQLPAATGSNGSAKRRRT